jgi:3-oxoacyl-[acyl-carrier-protein] synthase II
VTPLGVDAKQTWRQLLAGQTIADVGRVALPAAPKGEPRVTQLAHRVAAEAIANAGWTAGNLADDGTALVVGTSKGAIDEWLEQGNVAGGLNGGAYGVAQTAASLARDLGIGGPTLTFCAACASGLHALARGYMLIAAGQASRVLVVAAESSLHTLFTACFRQLRVLTAARAPCRPFDVHRDGFILSEAAAAVCLEPADRTATSPIALLEHFAIGGDAAHVTNGDPTGATLRRLLSDVLANKPADLVHAHGTGTLVNDSLELAAIDDAFQHHGAHAHVYSHKGALGHSLGASGLVSVVLNVLMHRQGVVLPNMNTTTPMPVSRHLALRDTPNPRDIRRSIVLASGFGGAMAAVSLLSPPVV